MKDVHGINFWDDEILCGADAWTAPILVTYDDAQMTCVACRNLVDGKTTLTD